MRRATLFVILALLVAPLTGCGGGAGSYEGLKRVAVKGKVTFDGEPVDRGSITLIPIDPASDKVRRSGGMIENGEFSITEANGPNVGKYRVEILWQKKTGKQEKDSDTGEMVDIRAEVIPAKYNTNSELVMDVVEGADESKPFDYTLTSK